MVLVFTGKLYICYLTLFVSIKVKGIKRQKYDKNHINLDFDSLTKPDNSSLFIGLIQNNIDP